MNIRPLAVLVSLAIVVAIGVVFSRLAGPVLAPPAVGGAPAGGSAHEPEVAALPAGSPAERVAMPNRVLVFEGCADGRRPRADAVVEVMPIAGATWLRLPGSADGWSMPEPGEYHVRVAAPGHAARELRLRFDGTTHEVVLRALGSVEVSFVDASGAPVAGVQAALSCRGPVDDPAALQHGLGTRQSSDAEGRVVWERVAAFLEYRYAVTSGHPATFEPAGADGVSGTFVPDGGVLRLRCVIAGSQICGRLPLVGGEQDVRVMIHRVVDQAQYPSGRRRPCFAAGRIFRHAGSMHPGFEISEGVFCFAGLPSGDYVLRGRWRDADTQRWSFVTSFARLTEEVPNVRLGTLFPLPTPAQRLRVQVSEDVPANLASELRARIGVNAGSAIDLLEQVPEWIEDSFEVVGTEVVELVGLPVQETQLDLRELVVDEGSGWQFRREARIEIDRRLNATAVAVLDLQAARTLALRLRVPTALGSVPGASALAVVVRQGRGDEPGQVIRAPLARGGDGSLFTVVNTCSGVFGAYVFVDTPAGRVAGLLVGQEVTADRELMITVEDCPPIDLDVLGEWPVDARTLDFAPAGLGQPVSFASPVGNKVTVKGMPASATIDCWGLPAGLSLSSATGRRLVLQSHR